MYKTIFDKKGNPHKVFLANKIEFHITNVFGKTVRRYRVRGPLSPDQIEQKLDNFVNWLDNTNPNHKYRMITLKDHVFKFVWQTDDPQRDYEEQLVFMAKQYEQIMPKNETAVEAEKGHNDNTGQQSETTESSLSSL